MKDDPTTGKVEPRFVLEADIDQLRADGPSPTLRLLGPFDPYLQLRDRELLVDRAADRKDLWRTLGRPGAIVADGEVKGTWRPRTSGKKFTVQADLWHDLSARRAQGTERASRTPGGPPRSHACRGDHLSTSSSPRLPRGDCHTPFVGSGHDIGGCCGGDRGGAGNGRGLVRDGSFGLDGGRSVERVARTARTERARRGGGAGRHRGLGSP